jgi:hypothetical protein
MKDESAAVGASSLLHPSAFILHPFLSYAPAAIRAAFSRASSMVPTM